jgi:hypothetical protein
MGENVKDEAQWFPSPFPLWELHLCGSCKCSEPWLKSKKNTKLGPQDIITKVLKFRCSKCPHIVHLDLICMSCDQKKGRESNWEFDYRPQIPRKQGSNEVQLRHVIHHWKDLFEGYKVLPSYFQKKDLIWKKYERPKFCYWDNKSPNFGTPTWEKMKFGCSPCGDA